jgi:class 3 adenylate cyclase/tetratricopeptide (TPR) repeat protein
MPSCPRCGENNPEHARFCLACGVALEFVPVREERKVVSALFADLVDSTARAQGLDPEDVRELQDAYWRRLRADLERYGGTVEKYIGDAVVGMFGAPVAHEDDPERAVRAALAIRDWAREQDRLQVRVGVATGEALVRLGAQPLAGEGMAAGEVMNTVNRIQAGAAANAILVDESTYRATKHAIDYEQHEPIDAKGKPKPLPVWEPLDARARFGVDVAHSARTPLVGRKRELDVLLSAVARAAEESTPQLVTLVGVPGIGKSRLVYELRQSLEADQALLRWRQGRSLPYGDGAAFWALGEIVKAEAGIVETDSADTAAEKITRAVEGTVPDERDWVERHLRPLVGVGTATAGGDGEAEAFAAWRRFLEALADERPSVFVFEDLHWAEEGLLAFIEDLLEWAGRVPILVVCTARPEFLEKRPNWGAGRLNATMVALSPLRDDETATVLDALLDRAPRGERRAALLDRIGGNPLFAEQFAFLLGDRGAERRFPLPETVHGVIAARLDGLSQAEKTLLQNASVFGKVFWEGAAVALDSIDRRNAADVLHSLERKEFVQRARRSSVPGETEYAFRHVLLRDVAYGQISRTDRAEKHERAAAWIGSLGRVEDHADLLAHHYATALELRSATGATAPALVARTRAALAAAGDRALAVNASATAASYYDRALTLLGDDDAERPALFFQYAQALFRGGDETRRAVVEEAQCALLTAGDADAAAEAGALAAEAAWYEGDRDAVDRHLERALALVEDRAPSPAKAHVLAAVARFRMLAARYDEAIEVGRAALAMAERFGADEIRAQTLITVGTARAQAGDDDGRRDVECGLEFALSTNNLAAAARGYQNLSAIADDRMSEIEFVIKSEDLWLRIGNVEGARYAQAIHVFHAIAFGQWDEALRLADDFIAVCEAGRPHYQEANVRAARAWIWLGRDDTAGAIADIEHAVTLARAAKDPQLLLGTLADAALMYVKLGRLEDARSLADELLAVNPRGSTELTLVADRLGLSAAIARAFDDAPFERRRDAMRRAAAQQRFEDAAKIAARIGERALAADLHLAAAEALLETGRSEEAHAQLDRALAFYRSVGATRFIRDAEALLKAARTAVNEDAPANETAHEPHATG